MSPTAMVPDPAEQPTVSVPEAGRIVGTGAAAAYAAVHAGELPVIKVGRKWRVPVAALRRMLQLDEPTGPSEEPAA